MNRYVDQIRSGETAVFVGGVPNRFERLPLIGLMLLSLPLIFLVAGLWIAILMGLLCAVTSWHVISAGFRLRDFMTIRVSRNGVHSRGTFVPWTEVADITESEEGISIELVPEGIAKFDDGPWDEQMRCEVARDGALKVYCPGKPMTIPRIADVLRFARGLERNHATNKSGQSSG